MQLRLCTIQLSLPPQEGLPEKVLTETLIAPHNIIQSFAKFLVSRDDECFKINDRTASFQDCSVSCHENPKAVDALNYWQSNQVLDDEMIDAMEYLREHDIPLATSEICSHIIADAPSTWKMESAFNQFVDWFFKNKVQNKPNLDKGYQLEK